MKGGGVLMAPHGGRERRQIAQVEVREQQRAARRRVMIDIWNAPPPMQTAAVFRAVHGEEQAREAEQALSALGVPTQRLGHSPASGDLSESKKDAEGFVGKFTNWIKGYGGEDMEAKRYSVHIDAGRVVIAVPAESQDNAQDITRVLTQHGAYDVTYFSDWTIVHESPAANARHGMPTYEAATEADEYTTGDITPGQSPRSHAE